MRKENWYNVWDYNDKITYGDEITVSHSVTNEGNLPLDDLITQNMEHLLELKAASEEREEEAFKKIQLCAQEWEVCAAETMRINAAIEYLKVPKVKHTENRWVKKESCSDMYEISNMVYRMTTSVYTNTKYDRALGKSVPVAWEVSWSVGYNSPDGYFHSIDHQNRKKFKDETSATKYLEGRKKKYAHLFTEINPEIPAERADLFKVNGVLVLGYRVQDTETK